MLPLPPPWPDETQLSPEEQLPQAPSGWSPRIDNFLKQLMALGFGIAASKAPTAAGKFGEGGMQLIQQMLRDEEAERRQKEFEQTMGLRERALDLEKMKIERDEPYRSAQAAYYNALAQRALRASEAGSGSGSRGDIFARAMTLIENVNKNYENLISRETQKLFDPLIPDALKQDVRNRIAALELEKQNRLNNLYRFYSRVMPQEYREEFEAIFGRSTNPNENPQRNVRIIDATPTR